MNSIGALFIALFLNQTAPTASVQTDQNLTVSVETSFTGQDDELANYEESLFLPGDEAPDALSDY